MGVALAIGAGKAVEAVQQLQGVCAEIAAMPRPQIVLRRWQGLFRGGFQYVNLRGEVVKLKQTQAKKRRPGCFKGDVADGSMQQEQQQEARFS